MHQSNSLIHKFHHYEKICFEIMYLFSNAIQDSDILVLIIDDLALSVKQEHDSAALEGDQFGLRKLRHCCLLMVTINGVFFSADFLQWDKQVVIQSG